MFRKGKALGSHHGLPRTPAMELPQQLRPRRAPGSAGRWGDGQLLLTPLLTQGRRSGVSKPQGTGLGLSRLCLLLPHLISVIFLDGH